MQLIVETDCRLDRIRQVRRGGELDRDTNAPTSFGLGLDVRHALVARCVGQRIGGRQVAFDVVRLCEFSNGPDCALVGIGVDARPFDTVALDELAVDKAVERGDLRRRIASSSRADRSRVEHDHRGTRLDQHARHRQAGNAGADDDHVDSRVFVERWKLRCVPVRNPR